VTVFNAIGSTLFPGGEVDATCGSAVEEIPDDDARSDHRGGDRDGVQERDHQS
jgi:hypothetical protein